MKKELLLVDGNSLFFKSFWSTWFQIKDNPNSRDRMEDGTPVNAVRTFATMMINLLEKFPSDKMLVAFDERGGHTHRHQHDFYKAGRADQPQELYDQIPMVREFLDHYGIKHHSKKEYEADDIIGILAERAKRAGYKVTIITTDKDLLQLVDEDVDVWLSKTGVSIMEQHTIENFKEQNDGLTPKQVIDFKGIAGDNSDNLQGVKGVGPKGAVKLLLEYDSLENVINNIDDHTPALQKKIEESKDVAILCKELATILTDGDIEIEIDELDVREPNWEALENFLEPKKLYSVLNKLDKEKDKWK